MLLILIKMKGVFDLVSQTLTSSLRVSAMFLLVYIASAATLGHH